MNMRLLLLLLLMIEGCRGGAGSQGHRLNAIGRRRRESGVVGKFGRRITSGVRKALISDARRRRVRRVVVQQHRWRMLLLLLRLLLLLLLLLLLIWLKREFGAGGKAVDGQLVFVVGLYDVVG